MWEPAFRDRWSRATIIVAALYGGAGVALAAAASHGGDHRLLGSASTICLAHAPVLVGLGLFGPSSRRLKASVLCLGGGTALFCTDLGMRHLFGHGLFPGAAPLGGLALIAGWAALAASAL